MPKIRFGVQDAVHLSRPLSAQAMVNCYLSESTSGSRTDAAVISSYGISSITSLENIKGSGVINGSLYVVDPDSIYQVFPDGNHIIMSSIASVSDEAFVVGDSTNIIVATDDKGYYLVSGRMLEIPDSDFPVPQWIGALDGYYPTIEKDSGRFWLNTNLRDVTQWSALDYATAEGSPDDLIWGLVHRRELILFGRDSIEIWYNSGARDFAFERVPNGFIELGIMSARAATETSDRVFFMGADGIAYTLSGYDPQRISNTFIERNIEKHTKDCRCLSWKEGGHTMVAFSFPEACHVFDASSGLWHRRQSYNQDGWDVKFSQLAHNRYYIGGKKLGYFDQSTFTEFGDILLTKCTSASTSQGKNRIPHGLLELNFDVGHNGTVMLRSSDDGGYTWSDYREGSLGATGNYGARVRFNALGAARDRIYEYSISDPYRRVLIDAYLNEFG